MPDNSIVDRAGEVLFDGMETLHNNVIRLGHLEKEVKQIKDESLELSKNLAIPAAHYYTAERIRELHQNTMVLMKCNDFDPEEYISVFSDSTKIRMEHIHFLWKRQKQLDALQQMLNVRECDPRNTKKNSQLVDTLADLFTKDGVNDV